MKRQSNLISFFSRPVCSSQKQPKLVCVCDDSTEDSETSLSLPSDDGAVSNLLIWSEKQREYFVSKYSWLNITEKTV